MLRLVKCLCILVLCLLVMFLLCAILYVSVYRYVLVFTFTMLSFHRETRKANTQEKYLELVESLYNPSLIPRLSCTPAFITYSMKAKQRMLGVWEPKNETTANSMFWEHVPRLFVLFATCSQTILVIFANFRHGVAEQSCVQEHDGKAKLNTFCYQQPALLPRPQH